MVNAVEEMTVIMKQFVILFLFVVCGVFGQIAAQNVTNVNAKQVGTAIHITYDLDRAADISVYVSTDGGKNYVPLHKVRGDVGKTIGPGQKTVVWDVRSEMEELNSDDIKFKVKVDANAEAEWWKKSRAEDKEKNNVAKISKEKKVMPYCTFLTLNMAYSPLPQWSFGFKIGQVKRVGWFVSLMTNFNFKGWGSPFHDDEEYYLTGDSKTIRFSAQAGLVYRPCKLVSILFGVGYGYRALTYCEHYYEINPMNGLLIARYDWHCYSDRTYNGVDVSLGLMFHIKGFALSAEAVTTNFQTVEAKVGVGFCLPHKKRKIKPLKI